MAVIKKYIKYCFCSILIIGLLISGCAKSNTEYEGTYFESIEEVDSYNGDAITEEKPVQYCIPEGYTLSGVVVFSRHNIRSPLYDGDSVINKVTPHKWFEWTSKPGELSLKGGALETMMGQYFRNYLEKNGVVDENYVPSGDEVRVYANSLQRTVATARFFSAGLFPVANVDVEYHMELGTMDPVFDQVLRDVDEDFEKQANGEILNAYENNPDNILKSLEDNFKVMEDVIDFKDSSYAKDKNIDSLPSLGVEINLLEGGEGPYFTGEAFSVGNKVADAIKLQYYETSESEYEIFGKKVTPQDLDKITEISDVIMDLYCGSPTLARNKSNLLLKELLGEINNDERKISFLCGHDSNVVSILSALGVKEYSLPNAISHKTPIGVKIVFEEVSDANGEQYENIYLLYQSVKQLKGLEVLDENNPPCRFELEFKGLDKNKDGLYKKSDVIARFTEAIEMP